MFFCEKMLVMMICAKDCKGKEPLLIFMQKVKFFRVRRKDIYQFDSPYDYSLRL